MIYSINLLPVNPPLPIFKYAKSENNNYNFAYEKLGKN